MRNHFAERWSRDEPRLTAVLVPPGGSSVLALAADIQRYLRQVPTLRCVALNTLHVPLADLGWSSQATDTRVASMVHTLTTVAQHTTLSTHPVVQGIHVDDTAVRSWLRNDDALRIVRASVIAAARMILRVAARPAAGRLDLAYCVQTATSDAASEWPHRVVAVARDRESLDLRQGSFSGTRIDLVDLAQDPQSGRYDWSVRASIALPEAPALAGRWAAAGRPSRRPAAAVTRRTRPGALAMPTPGFAS